MMLRSREFQAKDKLFAQGGIVEERVLADAIESPSVQLRVTPLGKVELHGTIEKIGHPLP